MGGTEQDRQESGRTDQPDDSGPDEPTPPLGIPMGEPRPDSAVPQDGHVDEPTPPTGISGLVGADGVIGSEDFGHPGPAVIGGADPVDPQPSGEADDWPKLEYRSRNKSKRSGALDWIRRRNDSG